VRHGPRSIIWLGIINDDVSVAEPPGDSVVRRIMRTL
jgi:hypothetical protein